MDYLVSSLHLMQKRDRRPIEGLSEIVRIISRPLRYLPVASCRVILEAIEPTATLPESYLYTFSYRLTLLFPFVDGPRGMPD